MRDDDGQVETSAMQDDHPAAGSRANVAFDD
jgi:hypothetical protein